MAMKKGKCLCGYIVFEVQASPMYMVNCFCRDCQIVSGSQFYGAYGVSLDSGLKNLSNEPSSYKVTSDSGRENTRKFCPKCGSRVWAEIPDLNLASVSGFALEDRDHFKPTINYHTKQAPKWCLIDKKMTSYEEQEVLATDQSDY
jgi:hypothetical protein